MIKIITTLLLSFSVFASEPVLKKGNFILMDKPFRQTSVANVMQKALENHSTLPEGEPMYLIIDSPGGSIQAGIELITFLNGLDRPVHTICNFCASMGFQTVQGVKGTRYIRPFGTLMAHKAKGMFGLEFPGQLDNRYNYYKQRLVQFDANTAARTEGKYSVKTFQELYENEYWCDGKDCIRNGFADEIVNGKCDSSLAGKHTLLQAFSIMWDGERAIATVHTDYSNCPLNTGVLNINIFINGVPYSASVILEDKSNLSMVTIKSYIKGMTEERRKVFVTL